MARNKELLLQTATEIGELCIGQQFYMKVTGFCTAETKYKVSTSTHSIDFAQADDSAYSALTSVVTGLNVGVLGEFPFQYSADIADNTSK